MCKYICLVKSLQFYEIRRRVEQTPNVANVQNTVVLRQVMMSKHCILSHALLCYCVFLFNDVPSHVKEDNVFLWWRITRAFPSAKLHSTKGWEPFQRRRHINCSDSVHIPGFLFVVQLGKCSPCTEGRRGCKDFSWAEFPDARRRDSERGQCLPQRAHSSTRNGESIKTSTIFCCSAKLMLKFESFFGLLNSPHVYQNILIYRVWFRAWISQGVGGTAFFVVCVHI